MLVVRGGGLYAVSPTGSAVRDMTGAETCSRTKTGPETAAEAMVVRGESSCSEYKRLVE